MPLRRTPMCSLSPYRRRDVWSHSPSHPLLLLLSQNRRLEFATQRIAIIAGCDGCHRSATVGGGLGQCAAHGVGGRQRYPRLLGTVVILREFLDDAVDLCEHTEPPDDGILGSPLFWMLLIVDRVPGETPGEELDDVPGLLRTAREDATRRILPPGETSRSRLDADPLLVSMPVRSDDARLGIVFLRIGLTMGAAENSFPLASRTLVPLVNDRMFRLDFSMLLAAARYPLTAR
eukprot:CAMPEP_0198127482 /NCGR_PEP_ID=MMETSP1442-20131203/47246_1 /TAXON_ID= /ORGANISM="Craspedostauros australis, Strain CCMP3328" /LENGTH=232 /DNA_ID=CAMNT_0043787459 /DNA_START=75 /DNA_END=770 /DNA_ORIENTATION=-